MSVININDIRDVREYIDLHILDPPKGRRKDKFKYYRNICAFDIETTLINKYQQSIMYIWQFAIDDTVIYGRTWETFTELLTTLNTLASDGRLVVYVHNLSFELQYLKDIIEFSQIFAMDKRSILYAVSGNIEFRCSYKLSNRSLDSFIKSVGGRYEKIEGFDYQKKRYPWTRLSDHELLYCINDVRGLTDAIRRKLEMEGDTLYSIPYTSTGYVRRIFKLEARPIMKSLRYMLPDLDVFTALRGAFRGGNTHANRWNSGRLLHDVMSYDISSSYPAVMLTERFPQKFRKGKPEYLGYYLRYDKAVLMHLILFDVRLKDEAWGCPYISKAKCDFVKDGDYDNGRILEAEACSMWITEVDLQILTSEYEFTYDCDQIYYADKRPLPIEFRKLIKRMYEQKTLLKATGGYEYDRYKELINSVYGMTVQNPIRYTYVYDEELNQMIIDESKTIEDLMTEYHRTGWLPYQFGVWTTAYARLRLEKGLNCIPPQAFIYADTDSIKFQGEEFRKNFDKLNRELKRPELSAKDAAGKLHHIGIYEYEGMYRSFKTLGAKKYVYEDQEGLHITIAGVNKQIGAAELADIQNFDLGFKFKEAGGLQAVYNDRPEPSSVRIQRHEIPIISNIALLKSTYTLGITGEYDYLINFLCNTDIRESLHYER